MRKHIDSIILLIQNLLFIFRNEITSLTVSLLRTYFTLDDLSFFMFFIYTLYTHTLYTHTQCKSPIFHNNITSTHLQLWFLKHVITTIEELSRKWIMAEKFIMLKSMNVFYYYLKWNVAVVAGLNTASCRRNAWPIVK